MLHFSFSLASLIAFFIWSLFFVSSGRHSCVSGCSILAECPVYPQIWHTNFWFYWGRSSVVRCLCLKRSHPFSASRAFWRQSACLWSNLSQGKPFLSNFFVRLAFVGFGVVFGFPSVSIVVDRWNGCGIVTCVNWLYCWRFAGKSWYRWCEHLPCCCPWAPAGSILTAFRKGLFGCTRPPSHGLLVWRWL